VHGDLEAEGFVGEEAAAERPAKDGVQAAVCAVQTCEAGVWEVRRDLEEEFDGELEHVFNAVVIGRSVFRRVRGNGGT